MTGDEREHRGIEAAEQAAAMMATAGMPRMPARVMMALVAAPEDGYTAAELADRLGVSAAAVSGAVRYLQQVHFIHRRTRPGDRRDRYELAAGTFYGAMASNATVYTRLSDYVARIAEESADDPAIAQRASEMSSFFRYLASRMPQLVKEWEESLGATPAP